VRILLFLICFKLSVGICLRADEIPASTSEKAAPKAVQEFRPSGPLTFAATNNQVLLDVKSRKLSPLKIGPNDGTIAKFTTLLLEQQHFSKLQLNDSISTKFLDRYLDALDQLHMHFLQSDLDDFESYRTILDDLIEKKGDVTPAHHIFARFFKRIEQRVAYVGELLTTEKFEFSGDDRYNLDRRKAAAPKTLDEARELWRQHLRYEILQEKLNKEKPEEIGAKISRRYARLLRMYQDFDGDDVFELYLSALTRVYDPHSDYMGKSALDNFNVSMKLALFGIGALLQSEDGYCKIKSLVPEGPAARSKKIQENDRIIGVAQGDNQPVDVVEMKLNKVVEMIRGPKGTEVRLTIIPADAHDPSVRKTVTLVRDEIKLEDQEAKAKIIELPGEKQLKLGVIDLPSFYADFEMSGKKTDGQPKSTTVDVAKLLRKLNREKVDGIILDLRRNGGGSLEEAINTTGLFIKTGPVVQVKDWDEKVTVDKDTDPAVLYGGPLVVLTSRFSASASEILAGALQDYDRALIVGDNSTHGKGTVQSLIQLDRYIPNLKPGPSSGLAANTPGGAKIQTASANNPGALKLTIRKFYRASGASTQVNGVTPDVILPSLNNFAEVGEASLDDALPYDTIPSAKYEKVNRIQSHVAELQKRSSKRVAEDKDFDYLREDIDQYKKALADRSVSLNEERRIKEKEEAEARLKARREELKARPSVDEKVYEITLKIADLPGLPPPVAKTNVVTKVEGVQPDHDNDGEDPAEPKITPVDVTLKETKRILADLISLSGNGTAVTAANGKNNPDSKAGGSLTGQAK
jgi:carboxyl-terminal processing protease